MQRLFVTTLSLMLIVAPAVTSAKNKIRVCHEGKTILIDVADAREVERQVDSGHVRVIQAKTATKLSASDAGREMRWLLMTLLIAVLVAEQLLSLRLSFHPEVKT